MYSLRKFESLKFWIALRELSPSFYNSG